MNPVQARVEEEEIPFDQNETASFSWKRNDSGTCLVQILNVPVLTLDVTV
jgi:hypothetical protein